MITRSAVDGFLKRRDVRQWLVAGWVAACIGAPLAYSAHLLNEAHAQTRKALDAAEYWRMDSQRWRAFVTAYKCPAVTSMCKAEKCWNVCTGEPSFEARP